MNLIVLSLVVAATATPVFGHEYHVAMNGADGNPGTQVAPLRTIQHAADIAQPGDIVTVHAGVYRERVNPQRGGTDEAHRITYQAAPGEKVAITGSEPAKGWKKISGDAWELTLPNSFFGSMNPFDELLYGSWLYVHGQSHHTGSVYLNGKALKETFSDADVLKPVGSTPLWHAVADGNGGPILMNVAWIKPAGKNPVAVEWGSAEGGDAAIYLNNGGIVFGYLKDGSILHYDGVDFGAGVDSVDISAASLAQGGFVALHLDTPDGRLLGSCRVANTGDWETFKTFTIRLSSKLTGKQNLCFVLKAPPVKPDGVTVIRSQFPPDVNPNAADVEISVRPEVFYPEKTGVNYITVRGFTLCNAATNWAPPSAEQPGLIGPRWSKGWIIENNTILNSRCAGISLGRPTFGHTHHYQKLRTKVYPEKGGGQTVAQLVDYFEHASWDKEAAGHHIVRNNIISHCGQAGIVGCSGGAFSLIEGNDISDVYRGESFTGWEMGCIKLHFAIDTIIRGNRLQDCGLVGLWLDWGAQGCRVTGNLFRNNSFFGDIYVEVSHGPLLVDNNIFLSNPSFTCCSQGIAFVHNLAAGEVGYHADARQTFFFKPHDSVSVGRHDNPVGDIRYLNNLFAGATPAMGGGANMPITMDGNVYLAGSGPAQRWLMNVAWFKAGSGTAVPASRIADHSGTRLDACSEGGQNVGFTMEGNWVRYDGVDFGAGTSSVEIRGAAEASYGGVIELRDGKPDGEVLGNCEVPPTGGWQKWKSFTVPIKPTSGTRNLCMVFHSMDYNSKALTAAEQATTPLVVPDVPKPVLKETPAGLYLTLEEDASWRNVRKRELVTTQLLGKAVIPNCTFENPDGSPLAIDTDYFGSKRDAQNPFPGPFETPLDGEVRVWPK